MLYIHMLLYSICADICQINCEMLCFCKIVVLLYSISNLNNRIVLKGSTRLCSSSKTRSLFCLNSWMVSTNGANGFHRSWVWNLDGAPLWWITLWFMVYGRVVSALAAHCVESRFQMSQVQARTGQRWSSNVVNALVYNVHRAIFALPKQFRLLLNSSRSVVY